jgi:DNA-directed RNA polymerase subunit N (RpoN/RPB10)
MRPPMCYTCGKMMWPNYYTSYLKLLDDLGPRPTSEQLVQALANLKNPDGEPMLKRLCCKRMVLSHRPIDGNQKYLRTERDMYQQVLPEVSEQATFTQPPKPVRKRRRKD